MKKILSLKMIACVLIVLSCISCSSDECADNAISADVDSQEQLCERVGEDHNLMVDHMFEQILAQTTESRSDVIPVPDPIDPIGPPVVPVKPIRFEYETLKAIEFLSISDSKKLEIKGYWTKVCDSIRLGLIDTTFVFNPSVSYNLHETQIENIFEDNDFDLSSLNLRLDNIKTNVQRINNDTERRVLLMGLSVAQNTLQYWHDNYNRICDSLNIIAPPILNPLSRSDLHYCQVVTRGWLGYNWKKAGQSDVKAALAAGIWYCGSGLAAGGPLSWQAGATYVAGRAAFASLLDLASQHFAGSGYSLELVDSLVDETYKLNYQTLLIDLMRSPYIDKPIIIIAKP